MDVKYFNENNYPDLLKNPLTEIKDIENFLLKERYSILTSNEIEIKLNFGSENGCRSFIEYKKDIINAYFHVDKIDINNNLVVIRSKN